MSDENKGEVVEAPVVAKKKFSLAQWNASQSGDYIGVMVWWTLCRSHLSLETVKGKAEECGLDKDLLIEPTAKKAFNRTRVNLWKMGDGIFSRKIEDGRNELVVGIVSERVNTSEQELKYRQDGTAKLIKGSNEVQVEGTKAQEFMDSFGFYSANFTDGDLRTFCRRVVDEVGGVPCRMNGGIYFIPAAGVATLDALDEFLRSLGVGFLDFARLPSGDSEKDLAWRSAVGEIEARISAVVKAMEEIDRKPKCLRNQIANLSSVISLIDTYAVMTGNAEGAAALHLRVEEVRKSAEEKLVRVERNLARRQAQAKEKAKAKAQEKREAAKV